MLSKMINIVGNMVVYEDRMKKNMELSSSTILAQKVLLFLVNKGMARDVAYKIIQSTAMEAMQSNKNFITLLKENKLINSWITEEDLKQFDYSSYLINVDEIFNRVFGE